MKTHYWKPRGLKAIHLLLVAALLAATLPAAALPQPALAATCGAYHIVKEGDTTSKIAQTYGLRWREIAEANDMEYPYKLKVGQRLCIPIESRADTIADNAREIKMTASVVGNTVRVSVSGLAKKQAYYVKVRDATLSVGGWDKLGVMRAKKTETTSASFSLPRDLRQTLYLQVCLKNGTNDELACRTVVHVY